MGGHDLAGAAEELWRGGTVFVRAGVGELGDGKAENQSCGFGAGVGGAGLCAFGRATARVGAGLL